ncbi:MAG: chorismate mutase [Dehalococcoidia bacterium]
MTTVCRGVRGATRATANTREAILEATRELLQELIRSNSIEGDQVAAVFFTTTTDLTAEFPAVAARQLEWTEVPLLGSQEMAHPDALTRCIRVLILINTQKTARELVHVYLRGTENLRSRGVEP